MNADERHFVPSGRSPCPEQMLVGKAWSRVRSSCAAQSSRVVDRHLSLPSPVSTAGYLKCSLTHEVISLSSKTVMRKVFAARLPDWETTVVITSIPRYTAPLLRYMAEA